MYRKITNRREAEKHGLDLHRFHAIDDETGDIEDFYTARDRNNFIDVQNEHYYHKNEKKGA